MSDTDPEIEILETEVAPPPLGSPPRFRELVALALKTTDADVLDAAEHDYRGIHGGVDAFIRDQLAEHLPPHLQWLLECCDPEKLRLGYEGRAIRIWTIAVAEGRFAVFESSCEPGRRRPR
ncbi:MAG TPA: hypothetical protein PLI83_06505 [Thermomonas sp.]|nr:hypothetical protein [Thermomonas sp.]